MRVTVRSRKARSCETTARPPAKPSTKRSRRSSPSKSRSFVGSSSRSRSKRESRIAASAARAASPPESVAVSWSSETGRPSSAQTVRARASRSPPPSARKRSSATAYASGLQSAVCRFTCGFCVGGAGAPREVAEQRLADPAVVLLRQVADRQRSGRTLDRALVRLIEPGRETEQRRLAGAVRADEAEPRARAERQVDAIENGVGAERADDACQRDSHGRAPPGTRGRGRAQRVRREERLVSSSPS